MTTCSGSGPIEPQRRPIALVGVADLRDLPDQVESLGNGAAKPLLLARRPAPTMKKSMKGSSMMKVLNSTSRTRLVGIAASVIGLLAATPAIASDNVTVTVNATVAEVCKFNSSTATLDLSNTGSGSNIDPSSATSATGSVGIIYRCSSGTAPAFTVPANVTLNNGSNTMVATITSTGGGNGTGMGNTAANQKTLTVSGSIAQSIFQDKAPGLYTNTMTVSITP
jgi:hypothetical protein